MPEIKKQMMVEVSFKLTKGYFGRFDFDVFIEESGLMAMLEGLSKVKEKEKRQDIQRLYNDLTKLWEEWGFIKFVGHKTVKGRRGRKFKIYEPCVDLVFKWKVEEEDDEDEDN